MQEIFIYVAAKVEQNLSPVLAWLHPKPVQGGNPCLSTSANEGDGRVGPNGSKGAP